MHEPSKTSQFSHSSSFFPTCSHEQLLIIIFIHFPDVSIKFDLIIFHFRSTYLIDLQMFPLKIHWSVAFSCHKNGLSPHFTQLPSKTHVARHGRPRSPAPAAPSGRPPPAVDSPGAGMMGWHGMTMANPIDIYLIYPAKISQIQWLAFWCILMYVASSLSGKRWATVRKYASKFPNVMGGWCGQCMT